MRFIFLWISLAFLSQGCNRQLMSTEASLRIAEPPAIDGNLSDWGHTLAVNTTASELQCFVGNDAENLYIAVRIQDAQVQAKAIQMGMTLWIDTLGKQQHHRGIGFPLKPTDQQLLEWSEQAKGDRIEMQNIYAKNCQEFELLGFVEEALRVSNFTSRDMKVGASYDPIRTLVFEVKLPIKQIIKRDWRENGIISVQAKINDPKKTIDDDNGGTFNDPNASTITQSNPLMGNGNPNNSIYANPMTNPNMMGGNRNMMPVGQYAPNIWVRVLLDKMLP